MKYPSLLVLSVIFCALFIQLGVSNGGKLRVGFYDDTCPEAEQIIQQTVNIGTLFNPALAAGFIRLYFHDCFVRGCDASVLLDDTPDGQDVEKVSGSNGDTLRGLDTIDRAKARLELACPGTVSCADILAFASRDAAVFAGLPHYDVHAGRRDGRISHAIDTASLPSPFYNLADLTQAFSDKGFSQEELVVLSGAHSIGHTHCSSFNFRLYSFNATHEQDPSLDPIFAEFLKQACPRPGTMEAQFMGNPRVELNQLSGTALDNTYYSGLQMGKGVLHTDQLLMSSERTRKMVNRWASHPDKWAKRFIRAMIKVGALDVLTGEEGEVRQFCRFVNQ